MCDFIGNTESVMEQHILLKHVNPGHDNMFKCDECNYKCTERRELGNHFKDNHKDRALNKDISKLRDELRSLKNNFERLEALYHESLEEVDKTKAEYEARLMEANDKFRHVKSENEELKEKVDVLFKLGRSYINRKELDENEASRDPVDQSENNAEVTIIEENVVEENNVEETNVEDLQAWTTNKLRGFKRTGPATYAEKVKEARKTQTKQNPSKKTPCENPGPQQSPLSATVPTAASSQGEDPTRLRRTRYCHYFSNLGSCPYEERTGSKCKFVHDKAAPMCSNGMSCGRNKCMYKHPNTAGRRGPFLGQNMGFTQTLNPWQMMTPWWNMNPNQTLPSPWGMEMNMERR